MPDPDSGRKSRWKRLLRIATWGISTLLVLCLLCYTILLAINWHDEPLTQETQAWLTEPANTVPDTQNAWLAMLALAYPQHPGPLTGRKILDLMHTAPFIVIDEDTDLYAGLDTQLQQTFGPPQAALSPSPLHDICSLKGRGPGILGRILQDETATASQIHANQPLLGQYYAAIALPQYAQEGLPVEVLPFQASGVITKLEASCLARMDLSLRLAQNDPKAGGLLQNHLQYWLTTLTHSHSLIGMMIANTQVQSDLDWASDLTRQFPQQTRTALQPVIAQYASFSSMHRHDLWLQPFQGELRFSQVTAKAIRQQMPRASALDRFMVFMFRSLYQPQATLNQRQACLAQLLRNDEQRPSPEAISSWLYNPLGKSLVGCADYAAYFPRVQVTQTAAGKFIESFPHQP